MDRPVRIAVVGPIDDRLLADLAALPSPPEVRHWPSLRAGGVPLLSFQPELLAVAFGPDAAEEVGALRFHQGLWPLVGIVVLTDAAGERQHAALAATLGAECLARPCPPEHLAAAVEAARHGGPRLRPEALLDLARGVADETNNPLLFAAGHLQLLRATLEATRDAAARDQVEAALEGMQRVRAAVDRLRLVAEAAHGPARRESVDLAALLATAVAARRGGRATATLAIAPGPHAVPGDPEQLQAAVSALVQFADDLAGLGARSHLELAALPAARRLQLTVGGAAVQALDAGQTFAPFQPNRALRTPGLGLGPFLARTIVVGHGGRAWAQREANGDLRLEFVLPA
ncbi:MAG: HAMP domain-containing histidine kinase [Planctomycetes bacterium]|nr:HAMP domain-containing histidine kinase [Planctomycetota bacterium]